MRVIATRSLLYWITRQGTGLYVCALLCVRSSDVLIVHSGTAGTLARRTCLLSAGRASTKHLLHAGLWTGRAPLPSASVQRQILNKFSPRQALLGMHWHRVGLAAIGPKMPTWATRIQLTGTNARPSNLIHFVVVAMHIGSLTDTCNWLGVCNPLV